MTTNLYALNRDGTSGGGHILPNLLRFAEVLRRLGLDAGPANVLDMVRATEHVHIGRRGEFYQAARSIFVHRRQDLPVFDEAFQVFWRKPNTARSGMDLRSMGEQRRFRKPQVSPGSDEPMDDALALDGDPDDDSVSQVNLTRDLQRPRGAAAEGLRPVQRQRNRGGPPDDGLAALGFGPETHPPYGYPEMGPAWTCAARSAAACNTEASCST